MGRLQSRAITITITLNFTITITITIAGKHFRLRLWW
jgi:hypothetical protein